MPILNNGPFTAGPEGAGGTGGLITEEIAAPAVEDADERAYMVSGKDMLGDVEMFVTADVARAKARHREMRSRLIDVQRNFDWDAPDPDGQ
jgi:hypothetical protein